MNVARSTFVRRGYLLTALAVTVLLAVSSGTAWAQSASFSGANTLQEGANTADLSKPRPLEVTITRSTTGRNDPYNTGSGAHLTLGFEYNGEAVTATNGAGSFTVTPKSGSVETGALATDGTAVLTFANSSVTRDENVPQTPDDSSDDVTVVESRIVLTIEDDPDDNDWDAEELVLTLTPGPRFPDATFKRTFKVTIEDDDPQPKFRFSSSDIQLAKNNQQTVTVTAGVGAAGASPLPGAADDTSSTESIRGRLLGLNTAGSSDILLSVEPPEAVGTVISISDSADMPIHPNAQGRYVIGTISEAVRDTDDTNDLKLIIGAMDVSGFRDEMISLTLMDGRTMEQMDAAGGGISDANPATVTVLSGAATPTVTFSKPSVSIMEGESERVHLLADTDQGDQVGSATVSVSGDARISLEQNGSAISGGTVSFDGSANAELTVVAVSDPDLEDGEESMATVTITDASGANIGDPRELTVTVVGATNVPVLPLVGQLLLALLLTAGGARLYRRRS